MTYQFSPQSLDKMDTEKHFELRGNPVRDDPYSHRAVTHFDLAQRYIGTKEIAGEMANPAIMDMLKLDMDWPSNDEVPWCSAFANKMCWFTRFPRSKDLRARSWLNVGISVPLELAHPGDIVILKRGSGKQPGPNVIDAPGHVGFFAGISVNGYIDVLGGNQSDSVKVSRYPKSRLLGVRRL